MEASFSSVSTICTSLMDTVFLAQLRKLALTSLGIYCMCNLTVCLK